MFRFSRRSSVVAAAAVASAVVIGGGGGYALAATTAAAPPALTRACVVGANRTLEGGVENASSFGNCAKTGGFAVSFNGAGTQGPAGPAGPKGATGATGAAGAQGPAGPQGPSGVISSNVTQLVTGSPVNVVTGGSFNDRSTPVGTVTLAQGTYEVTVNVTATPNAVTGGQVFPFVAMYNGTPKPDFSNDLANIGSGALEQETTLLPASDSINSNFGESERVVVPAGGETLNFLAFGNDSDLGEGSYSLNSLSVTATALNVQTTTSADYGDFTQAGAES